MYRVLVLLELYSIATPQQIFTADAVESVANLGLGMVDGIDNTVAFIVVHILPGDKSMCWYSTKVAVGPVGWMSS